MNDGAREANQHNYERRIESQNDQIIKKLNRIISLLEILSGERGSISAVSSGTITISAQCTCGTSAICPLHGPRFVS